MSMGKMYRKELKNEFDYNAIWLPQTRVELGDVIIVRKGKVVVKSTLKDQGISFKTRSGRADPEINYLSQKDASVDFKLAGELPPVGSMLKATEAGAHVSFRSKDAIAFFLTGCESSIIRDVLGIEDDILRLYHKGHGLWKRDYYLVTEVVSSKSATILISRGKNGCADLHARAGLKVAGISLADLDSKFEIGYNKSLGLEIVSKEGLTPLVRLMRIRDPLFGDPVMDTVRMKDFEGAPPKEQPYLAEVDLPD